MELKKEKNMHNGIDEICDRSRKHGKSILFSYSFRFDVRDVLPLLTHPSDKNNYRLFWTQPSSGFAFAGLGSVITIKDYDMSSIRKMKDEIMESMRLGLSIGDNSLIGPRMFGGFSFNLEGVSGSAVLLFFAVLLGILFRNKTLAPVSGPTKIQATSSPSDSKRPGGFSGDSRDDSVYAYPDYEDYEDYYGDYFEDGSLFEGGEEE